MRVEGSLKDLAKLGDAIINFTVSAVLTLMEGRPRGIKVPNELLRKVAARAGVRGANDVKPEDLLEAVVAYAWLRGFSVGKMVRIVLSGARKGGVQEGLVTLLQHLSKYENELMQQAKGWNP